MNRREALKVIGALVLSACAPAAPASEASTPTPIVIGGQAKTLEPSPRVDSTKKPDITPNPVEQRVKIFALGIWKTLLSKYEEDLRKGVSLRTTLLNRDAMEKISQDLLAPNAKPSEIPITMRWHGWAVWGDKWVGEVQFNNIEVRALGQAPTDPASRANGIEWAGGVEIKFIERSRSSFEIASYDKRPALEEWLKNPEPSQGFPEFSLWQNAGWGIQITLQNSQIQTRANYAQSGMFQDMLLPTTFACNPQGCKRIIVDLK